MKGDARERIFCLCKPNAQMDYARVVPVAVLVDAALIIGQFYYVAIIVLLALVMMVFNAASAKDVIPH